MRDPFWKSITVLLRFKRQLAMALAGALVSAACFGAGILTLLPALKLLLDEQKTLGEVARQYLGAEDRSQVLQSLGQWIELHAPSDRFWAFLAVMGLVATLSILGSTGRYVHELLSITLVNRSAMIWRKRLFRQLIQVPTLHLLKSGNADHISRLLFDVRVMTQGYMAVMGKAAAHVLKGAAALGSALLLDWLLTAIALIGLVPIAILLRNFGTRIRRASRRALRQRGYMVGALNEALGGIHVVKVHNAEGYERRRFGIINKALFNEDMKMRQAKALASPLVDTMALLGAIGVATIAAWSIFHMAIEPEQVMTVVMALVLAAASFKPLANLFTQVREASAAALRVMDVLNLPTEPTGADSPDQIPPLSRHCRAVVFDQVSVSYSDSDRPAVEGVSLAVPFGDTVAVVGANGAGKTTLMHLLPRLVQPQAGRVLIDDHDIQDVSLRSLRQQIGVVTQQCILFEGTIAENIAYGRRYESDERIVVAAKLAHAHEFISALASGYQTRLSEDGAGLSGGQMQRICIARAILRDPTILILDEATSQIDADSEAEISKALRECRQGRTTFIIAHRLSTVIDADQIVVMDAGRIADTGRHGELIERCVAYRTLAHSQLRPPAA